MLKQVILHIGAGKCGSSALQQFLSFNPVLETTDGKKVLYGTIGANGNLLTGELIADCAITSPTEYLSCKILKNCNQEVFESNFRESLKNVDAEMLVLSCEGWNREAKEAEQLFRVLASYKVIVLMYVRPPVDWVNSAWWQWGAWTKSDFTRWLNKAVNSTKWVEQIEEWKKVGFVDKLLVRVLPKDIIQDFAKIVKLNIPSKENHIVNKSLPDIVLRVYQMRNTLRPSAHNSKMDFSLSKYLKTQGKPAWVLSQENVEYIIEQTRSANCELLDFFNEAIREKVKKSPAWWNADYYKDRKRSDPLNSELSQNELLDLLEDSFTALHKLDLENKELKKQLS